MIALSILWVLSSCAVFFHAKFINRRFKIKQGILNIRPVFWLTLSLIAAPITAPVYIAVSFLFARKSRLQNDCRGSLRDSEISLGCQRLNLELEAFGSKLLGFFGLSLVCMVAIVFIFGSKPKVQSEQKVADFYLAVAMQYAPLLKIPQSEVARFAWDLRAASEAHHVPAESMLQVLEVLPGSGVRGREAAVAYVITAHKLASLEPRVPASRDSKGGAK